MTRVSDETVHGFHHGRVAAVGVSAVALGAAADRLAKGVQLRAGEANTALVYVGGPDVTAGSTPATDGFPLAAGEALFVPIDRIDKLYVVAEAADQDVYWFAL